MDNKKTFILATIWWFTCALSSVLLMKCAIAVGGIANIAAGIIMLASTTCDVLLGISGIISYMAGRKQAMDDIVAERLSVVGNYESQAQKAGQESVENENKEENKNENV